MTFKKVRVISKGNKYLIEFLYPSSNLLAKLRFKLLKSKDLQPSKVNDGRLAFVPTNDQEFVDAINRLELNNTLMDYAIEKYYQKDILTAEEGTHPEFKLLTVSDLIDIAIRKYKVPDYKINPFHNACLWNRKILFNEEMKKSRSPFNRHQI